jgi:hypothetical protein
VLNGQTHGQHSCLGFPNKASIGGNVLVQAAKNRNVISCLIRKEQTQSNSSSKKAKQTYKRSMEH